MADDTTAGAGAAGSTATDDRKFTQADLDRLIDARLARERGKYADYDDLKAKAAAADKDKSQLDKVLEQLADMKARTEKAEHAALIAEVAADHKLTPRQARRLQGKTREELVADAKELLEDMKPSGAGSDGKGAAGGDAGNGDGKGAAGGDAGKGDGKGDAGKGAAGTEDAKGGAGKSLLGTRPRDNLTSGAVPAAGGADQVDHAKLAEDILKGL